MEFIEPIWEKQPKESIQAYEAFNIYMNLGSKRSLKLVSEKTGKSISCIKQWSKRWEWVKRVYGYDIYLYRLEQAERENMIQEALKRHNDMATAFQQKALDALEKLTIEVSGKLNPLQFIQYTKIGIDLERVALGIAPIGEEIRLNQAQERIELHKQQIESKNGNDLEDSSEFIEGLVNLGKQAWNDEK